MFHGCSSAFMKLGDVVISICHIASERQLQNMSFTSMLCLEPIMTG